MMIEVLRENKDFQNRVTIYILKLGSGKRIEVMYLWDGDFKFRAEVTDEEKVDIIDFILKYQSGKNIK